MKPFLDKLAEELLLKHPNPTVLTVIFPSRRAGIFFKKYLSQKLRNPIFSPEIFSISDYIEKLSPYRIATELELIIDLYEVFRRYYTDETEEFEKFYPWGKMMLSDFDEVDKELVDASRLFKAVKAEKKIEEQFEIDFEFASGSFWNLFTKTNPAEVKKDFLKTWEIIGKVYEQFKTKLIEKKAGYEGMCYRKVYEMVQSGELRPFNLIFAGFNFLTKCEEGIILKLLINGAAEVYWDCDEYYIKNEKHEAGKFLRKNFKKLKLNQPLWLENILAEDKKKIKIIPAPLLAGQAKAAGEVIKNINDTEHNYTAIVLPDESLLIPLLSSLPDSVRELNVTMGYPLRDSNLYRLIQLVSSLHSNKKNNRYYYRNVCEILLHPYIRFTNTSENFKTVNKINKNNIIYLDKEKILGFYDTPHPLISSIFSDPEEKGIYLYLTEILLNIKDNVNGRFDREFIFRAYSLLNDLHRCLEKYNLKLKSNDFIRFFTDIMNLERIPFVGEPLKGLQVMGLLETRTLDFENIIILSMNEGSMPKPNRKSSYIPYNIRKSFGLQTYEDEDAISSYLFYRLIQRAKNIYIIYKTEEEGLAPGEKSRFIMQIEHELINVNKQIEIEYESYIPHLELRNRHQISVIKNDSLINKLKNFPYFSPSALSIYISCSLRFYLEKVLHLKKEDSAEEVISGAGFGNILHYIMLALYRNYKGMEINTSDTEKLKKEFEQNYDNFWLEACNQLEELEGFSRELSGRNQLMKTVMKRIVLKILENDKLQAPFRIINLELPVEKELKVTDSLSLKLKGVIDRVEEKDGFIRIIDYKTGRIEFSSENTRDLSFEKIFTNPKFREIFQQFFYAYLYNEIHPVNNILIGLYHLRESSRGIEFISPNILNKKNLEEFELNLKKLLLELFNPAIAFSQTSDRTRCKWCDFKSICYREDT